MNVPDLNDVLAAVNTIRELWGAPTIAEIPPGRRACPFNCPLASALSTDEYNCEVAQRLYRCVPGTHRSVRIYERPVILRDFIAAFDQGEYPELELEPDFGRRLSDLEDQVDERLVA